MRSLVSVLTRDLKNSSRPIAGTTASAASDILGTVLRKLQASALMLCIFAAVQLHVQVNCSVLVFLNIIYHTFCYLSIVFLNFFVYFIFNITFTIEALTFLL